MEMFECHDAQWFGLTRDLVLGSVDLEAIYHGHNELEALWVFCILVALQACLNPTWTGFKGGKIYVLLAICDLYSFLHQHDNRLCGLCYRWCVFDRCLYSIRHRLNLRWDSSHRVRICAHVQERACAVATEVDHIHLVVSHRSISDDTRGDHPVCTLYTPGLYKVF